jgi:hypothetical protein
MTHSRTLLRKRFYLAFAASVLLLVAAVLVQGVLDDFKRAYFPDADPRVTMVLQLILTLIAIIILAYILAAQLAVNDALDFGHVVDKGFAQQTAIAQQHSGILKGVTQRLDELQQAHSISRQPPATAYWGAVPTTH